MSHITAVRPGAGAYLPQFVHTVEKRVSEVADLRAKAIPFIAFCEAMGLMAPEDAPYSKLLPNVTDNQTPVTPYGYGVTPPVYFGGYAGTGRIEYATYLAPVGYEHMDEINRLVNSPDAAIDLADLRFYNAMKAQGENMEQDAVYGNGSNAMRMTGLEQWLPPAAQLASTDTLAEITTAPEWHFRQCTGTVQGLTRLAMTGPSSSAQGNYPRLLNHMSIDFADIGVAGGSRTFGVTSGDLNDVTKIFEHFYGLICQGTSYPDIILSTPKPLSDARRAGQSFVSFVLTNGASANIGPSGVMYGKAAWYSMTSIAASGTAGAATTAGADSIYLIDSDHMRIELDKDRILTPVFPEWQVSTSPLGWYQQFELRAQMIMDAPGYHGSIANYGT